MAFGDASATLCRVKHRERNIYRRVGQMLLDAAQLRHRKRIIDLVKQRGVATIFYRVSAIDIGATLTCP